MNIRFIDTSIIMNLLEIPGKCQDKEKVQGEFKEIIEAGDMEYGWTLAFLSRRYDNEEKG